MIIPSIAPGSCAYAYFTVAINRTSAAYDTKRSYHITAVDSQGVTVRTPYNRELYVEHLVSQNRNSVTSVAIDGVTLASGATTSLVDGRTYNITLTGATSTNGYNQIESLLTLSNTIFQINSVNTTYSAGAYSLRGLVWHDVNKNTTKEASEDPIPGITVTLYNSAGVVVAHTTTNSQGEFTFNNLPAGEYIVRETDGSDYPLSTTANTRWVVLSNGTPAPIEFGDYQGNPECVSFIDPAINASSAGYPNPATIGSVFTFQFQVTNNGTLPANDIDVYTSIPSYLQALSMNVSVKADPGVTVPVDSHHDSLVGNSLMINFSTLTPGYTYNVAITTIVLKTAIVGTHDFAISLNNPTPSCGAVSANDSGSVTLRVSQNSAVEAVTVHEPETGFAPGVTTRIPLQPLADLYQTFGSVSIQIPDIKMDVPLVGIPQMEDSWDITWLGDDAGWLNGTAFPGFDGNSVIVGHVFTADGQPGPMNKLETLQWGDQILVQNGNETLVYAVTSVAYVKPNDPSIFKHSDTSVLTLVTCKGYNEVTGHYNWRVVVKAKLVETRFN